MKDELLKIAQESLSPDEVNRIVEDLLQAQARKHEREKYIQQMCRNVGAINIIEHLK
jgi:hypothetical protein